MVDTIDLKIITQLEINSRASYVEIGSKLGFRLLRYENEFKLEDTGYV
jgi:DNA-binding Lrp family transcriptional regulator